MNCFPFQINLSAVFDKLRNMTRKSKLWKKAEFIFLSAFIAILIYLCMIYSRISKPDAYLIHISIINDLVEGVYINIVYDSVRLCILS